MIDIDGSQGEGGGQILRTSLALSLCTGRPFRIHGIRARRPKPGLMRQHLTAVNAAAQLGRAQVAGAALGSLELTFAPEAVRPGSYRFAVGTAGSTTLVLQTVLPALLRADAASQLRLEGGTHNPLAPPFEFLALSFLPLVGRMGPRIAARLERYGFFPAGGGELCVEIEPARTLQPLHLDARGELRDLRAEAIVANLAPDIGRRELQAVKSALGLADSKLRLNDTPSARGPGNVLLIVQEYQQVTAVFTGFGERGVRAETVAARTVAAARAFAASDAAVDQHLADQLLLPLALAGGGSFTTGEPSGHTLTNSAVIEQFLPVRFTTQCIRAGVWRIGIERSVSS